MPELDLSAAAGLRVAGKDASEVRAAGRTVWEKPAPPAPTIALTFVTTTADQVAGIGLSGATGGRMDWGDGTSETFTAGGGFRAHTYAEPGTYRAAYSGPCIMVGFQTQSVAQMSALVSVDAWGEDFGPALLQTAFRNARNLVSVATPPPGSVTSLASTFHGATAFTGDISGWDTSQVTTFNGAFNGATAFNSDLSNWDTSRVTDMNSALLGCRNFDADISRWDTSQVTNMGWMLADAASFNRDLSGWDVSKVTNHTNFNTGANPDWVANAAWQPQWPA